MTGTPATLTTNECNTLLARLEHFPQGKTKRKLRVRNRCMTLLMLDAGLRVGEVVKLSIFDLYFCNEARYQLRITETIAKNKTERIVPLSQRIRKAIEAMQVFSWSLTKYFGHDYAFRPTQGTCRLTTRQVERITRDAAMKSLGRPVHPHVFRHTFASRLMRTTNARIVQELLGHQHMSTTQIYTHPNQQDLKKAIDSLDPNQPNNDVTES